MAAATSASFFCFLASLAEMSSRGVRMPVEYRTNDPDSAGLDLEAEPVVVGSARVHDGGAIQAEVSRDARGLLTLHWAARAGLIYWIQHSPDGLTYALISEGLGAGSWTDASTARSSSGHYRVIESAIP